MSDAAFWRGGDEAPDHAVPRPSTDLDYLFSILSNPRRRALLYLLQDLEDEPAWTTNLAVQLARLEADDEENLHEIAEEIALTLRHNHLPKLADVGLIDTDTSMTTLTYEGDGRLEALLEWSRPNECGGPLLPSE